MNRASERKLLRPILRDVSRSFYVSIRLLPRRLRQPVGLAYLLARAADTLADTVKVSPVLRAEALQAVAAAIQGGNADKVVVDLRETFAPLQTDEAERKLIETLPDCFELLELLNLADRSDIRQTLSRITRGQMLDLQRFGDSSRVVALSSAADLREYTYLVAGCVGEFWTHLCFRYIADFATEAESRMLELGQQYGHGLQLVNILRDAEADLASGRCYFPEEELKAIGLFPSEILNEPGRFEPIFQRWLDEAGRGLEAGMEYVRAINHFRVRGATALPALIGARTLSLLRAAGANALRERVKVPRKDVRGMIASVAITLARPSALDEMFARYKK